MWFDHLQAGESAQGLQQRVGDSTETAALEGPETHGVESEAVQSGETLLHAREPFNASHVVLYMTESIRP